MVMEYGGNRKIADELTAQTPDAIPGAAVHNTESPQDTFLTTVELVASGICHVDPDGRFLYVNPAMCQLMGYSREELYSRSFQDITHPDDISEHEAHFRRLLAGEIPAYQLEQRCYRQDGSVAWVRVNATLRPPAPDIGTHPNAIAIAVVEDISEHKRLEGQLRATNERLALDVSESQQQANDMAAAFEAITDLVVVFDKTGHIRRANRAVSDFMVPQPTIEAGRQHLGLTDTQGQPLAAEQWVSSRVLRGETITGAQAVDMEAHTADGHTALLNVSGAPVRDSQGQIVGGVLVMRDVTGRRRLERRTQEALDALLEMAKTLVIPPSHLSPMPLPEGSAAALPALNPAVQRLAELAERVLGCQRIGIVALERGSDIMHPMALTGLTPEHAAAWCMGLEGRSMTEYIGSDRMRILRAGMPALLNLNQPPIRNVAHGGPVALSVPLCLDDQLVGALALGYEREPHNYVEEELRLAGAVGQLAALVVERERLLQEREEARANTLALQEANRRMDEFLGIASHELHTPLTALLGNVQLLERRLAHTSLDNETADDLANQLRMVIRLLAQMDRQGRRLGRLISDLVDASRIEAGKLDLRQQPSDLASIVREMVEEQRQAHPQRTINLDLPENIQIPVVVDADRLGQVVANYLTNALKYSREDQPVAVDVHVEDKAVRVSVRDQGPGLHPDEQSRIWELFHRAPDIKVQSGSGIGLGLGLHICKTIIERHNGRVGVTSAIGKGSTFWFTLPLSPEDGSGTATAS
ncbi:MAG TPA: PAS domain S-box protein [Ktedonobacterales bacterium]|nr:PAS domain S-box protein [Ktedonobacterales bacterium]